MLSGTDGIELMSQVPEFEDVPVIFISAYGRDETITRAIESGAVDYIVKPFSPTEPVARVRAALRDRSEPETYGFGELTIDYGSRRVRLGGRVRSAVKRLRKKLGDDADDPTYIFNEHGIGYRMPEGEAG